MPGHGGHRGHRSALPDIVSLVLDNGLRGLDLDTQLAAFCDGLVSLGLPLARVQLGMGTIHPEYGARTFVWRPGEAVQTLPRSWAMLSGDAYRNSPVNLMRGRGLRRWRQRLDEGTAPPFALLHELAEEGCTEYAAEILPFDPEAFDKRAAATAAKSADPLEPPPVTPGTEHREPGIFFSCATKAPGGFEDTHLEQISTVLPTLALATKSRLTYDVAETVVETYLGRDAGVRVLNGSIVRGSAQRLRAAIWFSDLRGFTRLADAHDETVLVGTLNAYFDVMVGAIHSTGGQVLKFMGDGLLATFDSATGGDAEACARAVAACRAMQGALPPLDAARREAGKPVMDHGLALHLGDVLYGNIGARDRLDFTVIGPAVNEAARMEALCKPLGERVLVSEAFHQALGDARLPADIEHATDGNIFRDLGLQELRGVRQPRRLFALS